jgi:hypothetical protein
MATRKKVFDKGSRFAFGSGWGYVINENQAILFGPKKGRNSKFVYSDEVPTDARVLAKCPESVQLAMDALDLVVKIPIETET